MEYEKEDKGPGPESRQMSQEVKPQLGLRGRLNTNSNIHCGGCCSASSHEREHSKIPQEEAWISTRPREVIFAVIKSIFTQIFITIGLDGRVSGWELIDNFKVLIKMNVENEESRSNNQH